MTSVPTDAATSKSRIRFGTSLIVAAVAATIFLTNLGAGRLFDDDEPKNAACAVEMMQRGDWVTPMFNGELRSHKPVMLYWWMMASYETFGKTEFAARLPSAVASIVSVLLCYHLGRMLLGWNTGLVAALLLSSGLMFAVLARAATPDGLLIVFTLTALTAFVWGVKQARGGQFDESIPLWESTLPKRATAMMYLAMGFAVLTKGPIGVLLPLASIIGFALFGSGSLATSDPPNSLRSWWTWLKVRLSPARVMLVGRTLRITSGLVIVAVVAVPWYVAVAMATEGAWLSGFLGTHNVHRFLEPMEGHQGPFFYHAISVLAGMFPASCFLPVAILGGVTAARANRAQSESYALLVWWAGMWITFFSIAATKLPNYVAPSYPALALLVAAWLVNYFSSESWNRIWLRLGLGSFAAVGLSLLIGLAVAAPKYLSGDYSLAMIGVVPFVGGIVALLLSWRGDLRPAVGTFVAASLVFTMIAHSYVAPRVSRMQASPLVGQVLAEQAADLRPVASFHYTKPNMTFYFGRPISSARNEEQITELLANDGVVVLPADLYATLDAKLPMETEVVARQSRFLQPDEQVLIIRRAAGVAVSSLAKDSQTADQRTGSDRQQQPRR